MLMRRQPATRGRGIYFLGLSVQSRVLNQEGLCPPPRPKGRAAMSGDTFGCPSWREDVTGISRVEARGPITARKAQGGPHKEGSSSTKCPRFRGREAESQTHGMVPNFPLDSDPGRSAWTAASATRKTADDCNGAESRASGRDAETAVAPAGPQGARPAPGLRWAGLDVRLPFFANAAGLALSWRPPQRVNRACPWNRGLEMSGRLHVCLPD